MRAAPDASGEDFSDNLPDEILLRIFRYLDMTSLSRTRLSCQRWRRVADDPSLYRVVSGPAERGGRS